MDEDAAAIAIIRSADHLNVIRQLLGYLVGLAVVIALLLLYVAVAGVKVSGTS